MNKEQHGTPSREWCWPFFHGWQRWQDHSEYTKTNTISKAVFEIGVVQERRCKRCNALQRRQVPDDPEKSSVKANEPPRYVGGFFADREMCLAVKQELAAALEELALTQGTLESRERNIDGLIETARSSVATNEGETPRTDAAVCNKGKPGSEMVPAHVSRHLERELALVERRLATSEELRTGLVNTIHATRSATATNDYSAALKSAHDALLALSSGKPVRDLDEIIVWIERLRKGDDIEEGGR